MSDLISRQSVLKAINNMVKECDSVYVTSALRNLEVIVADVPSAQPETHEERTETHACDCISRQAAIEAIRASTQKYTGFMEMEMYTDDDAVEAIINLPSAQPEHTNSCYTNSWCIDCKEYDTENKCCPKVQKKHGKWIERESDTEDKENGFETVIVCSHCDFPATTFYSEDYESRTQIRTDFCPNCGAEMGDEYN